MSETQRAAITTLHDALSRRDRRRINDILARLLTERAPLGERWLMFAKVLAHNLEWPLAINACHRYVSEQRNSPPARLELATMLHRAGRLRAARDVLEALPADVPSVGGRLYMLGTLDTMLGRSDAARSELREATLAEPDAGHHWLGLAMTGDVATFPDLAQALRAAERQSGVMRNRGQYRYALGKALADLGLHDDAFDAFAAGAQEIGKQRRYDPAAAERLVSRVIAESPQHAISFVADRISVPTGRPIIVTGLPRSGTTLVEQILTSHSEVADGAELGLWRVVAEDIGGFTPHALRRRVEQGADPNAFAALYLHLADARFGATGRIVDKTLSASRTLGLTAALLPDAPIIWMRRGTLDTAWSCFRTFFVEGNDWSWSLGDLAHHFRMEDRLLQHWRTLLGDRLLVLDYEGLVSEPTAVIPRLLAHAGLDMEEATLTPDRSERSVTTASVNQVRAPITSAAIGVAAPYARQLAPFITAHRALGGDL